MNNDLVSAFENIYLILFKDKTSDDFKDEVEYCRRVIRDHFPTRLKEVTRCITGYGLKHLFERFGHDYINELSLNAAFILEKFSYHHVVGTKQSCYFNISKRDLKEFSKAIREG